MNYQFGLNTAEIVDAVVVGNETRFLNHSKDANCEARSRLFHILICQYSLPIFHSCPS
jgi:SET domain-containing protein